MLVVTVSLIISTTIVIMIIQGKKRERETDQGATTTEGVTQLPPRTHFLFCPKIYSDDLTVTGLCRVVWWWQTWLLSHLTPH